jgi:hypothetical protein
MNPLNFFFELGFKKKFFVFQLNPSTSITYTIFIFFSFWGIILLTMSQKIQVA